MPPALKSLLALVAAAGMVAGAVVARGALDEKEVNDAIQVRLTCDPLLADACRQAAAADPRLKVTVEPPATTQRRLVALDAGDDPGLDAWVTVGPWLAMVDGARTGQERLGRSSRPFASSPVVLLSNAAAGDCPTTPVGCAAVRTVGLRPPTEDGIGLAGTTALVAAAASVPLADLDRGALVSGPAAGPLSTLKGKARPIGLEAVNAAFANAQAVVTTGSASAGLQTARVRTTALPVRAVAEVALLREDAGVPLAADGPAGAALRDAQVKAGWDGAPQPSGLPDADVLAALQGAWAGA